MKPWSRLALMGLAAVGFVLLACGGSDPESHDELTAYVMAQGWVEDRLVSPATADFPAKTYTSIKYLGDGKYRVRAWVDSQNAFGATVRTDFEAVVQWVGGTNWKLVSLELME